MLKGSLDYNSTDTISKFWHTGDHSHGDHGHDSIWNEHSFTALNMAKRMCQGAGICLAAGFIGYMHKIADKQLLIDRAMFQRTYLTIKI